MEMGPPFQICPVYETLSYLFNSFELTITSCKARR